MRPPGGTPVGFAGPAMLGTQGAPAATLGCDVQRLRRKRAARIAVLRPGRAVSTMRADSSQPNRESNTMRMRRRPVRLATISHRPSAGADGKEGTGRLLKEAARLLERAARMGADLVAFPEVYPQLALSDPFHHAEPSEGGTLEEVCALAKRHKLLVVWPRVEYDPSRGVRNTAVLVDRSGEILGRYDKMFPTTTELEKGVIPGTEAPSSRPISAGSGC